MYGPYAVPVCNSGVPGFKGGWSGDPYAYIYIYIYVYIRIYIYMHISIDSKTAVTVAWVGSRKQDFHVGLLQKLLG